MSPNMAGLLSGLAGQAALRPMTALTVSLTEACQRHLRKLVVTVYVRGPISCIPAIFMS
jgi:hypothetical protein